MIALIVGVWFAAHAVAGVGAVAGVFPSPSKGRIMVKQTLKGADGFYHTTMVPSSYGV